MSLPPEITQIRLHPSIGIARLSSNPDTFVFGERPQEYKSNDRIKRQCVQFRLIGYDSSGRAVTELTPEVLDAMGLRAKWRAKVGNRKIMRGRSDSGYEIHATSDSESGGSLVGRCGDFEQGQQIPLGHISETGLFTPPNTGVFAARAGSEYPRTGMHSRDFADNTCDGIVDAVLVGPAGEPVDIDVLPSWIIVAPPDFAPDWDDGGPDTADRKNLLEYLQTTVLHAPGLDPPTPLNETARALDHAALEPGTCKFGPGIEIGEPSAEMFMTAAETGDPDEIRVRRQVSPGQLTSSLCSPWQFDFRACTCSWWPNHRPDTAFRETTEGPRVNWRRKKVSDTSAHPDWGSDPGALITNKDFIEHVDELGIIRRDDDHRIETERDNDID